MRALVELIERYRPGYSATIEPASSIEIEDLDEAAGPLPGSYLRFLKTMGRSLGDFDVDDLNFNVYDMLLAYQLEPRAVRDQYLRIAGDRGPAGLSYYVDRAAPFGHDDCAVVVMVGDPQVGRDHCDRLHAGLEEFLYVEAYRTVRLPMFQSNSELICSSPARDARCTAERTFEVAAKLGFERVAPAQRSALFERGDAAIVLYRHPIQDLFSFRLGADDPDELSRMISVFRDTVGVEIAGSRPV